MNTEESVAKSEVISAVPGVTGECGRTTSHYRFVWCGVLDSERVEIAAGAQRVSYEVCTVEGSRSVRLPRLVVEVLNKTKPGSLRGVSPARFDGTLDYGYLVLQSRAEAENLARRVLKLSEAVARRRPEAFGYLSLEVEASEWQAPVDTPLYVPVSGKVLLAVQIRSRGGEVVIGKRVAKTAEALTTPAADTDVQPHGRWVC